MELGADRPSMRASQNWRGWGNLETYEAHDETMSTSTEDFQEAFQKLTKYTKLLHRILTVFPAAGSWEAL